MMDFNCNMFDENESAYVEGEQLSSVLDDWTNMASNEEERYSLFSDLTDIEPFPLQMESISNFIHYLREEEDREEHMSVTDSDSGQSDSVEGVPGGSAVPGLVSIHPDLVYGQDEEGDTKLHTAIICNRSELAIDIINCATDQSLLSIHNNVYRQTPLHLAVEHGDAMVVRRLVVGGADLAARDYKGDTPVHLACRRGTRILKELLRPVERNEGVNNKYTVTGSGQDPHQCLEIVNYLEGFTPLHVAMQERNNQSMDVLIRTGADVNAIEGRAGKTVLHKACENGDLELVRYLIQQENCQINAKTYDNDTPFDFARYRGHEEITTQLLRFAPETDGEEDQEG